MLIFYRLVEKNITEVPSISIQKAASSLREVGLRLWLFIAFSSEDTIIKLSQGLCEEWGIKRSSYYAAMKELQEKGYLIYHEDTDSYTFYDISIGG